MAARKISQATETDVSSTNYETTPMAGVSNSNDLFKVNPKDTDGATGSGEFVWTVDWALWHGYYRQIPEMRAVIDKLGSWTVGRGYESDKKKQLDKIKGWGKDDFNSILENCVRTFFTCGDSFAEIIRDSAGRLTNLKMLNPGRIEIVVNELGILEGYRQLDSKGKFNGVKWDPKEMLHFAWNRIADEVHGVPFIEAIQDLIKMRNEAMRDLKIVFHRYVKPINIISVKTDDPTEISNFKTTWSNAYNKVENIIVPADTVEKIERVSIPQFSTLDPLPWIKHLIRQFTTASGVPEVVMGWGEQTTEASAKIIYLAFQQTIERVQRFVEAQFRLQTGVIISLNFPASIEPDITGVKDDNAKDPSSNKFGVDPTKDQK